MQGLVTKTVEVWVNEADFSEDLSYIPSVFALEFVNFIKLVNGVEGEENLTPILHYKMLDQIAGKKQNIVNMLFRGASKSLALNTPILTPTGYVPMELIHTGDTVIDRKGDQTTVIAESEIHTKPCYKFIMADGTSFVAAEDHLHIVQKRTSIGLGKKGLRENVWKEHVLSTLDLLEKGVKHKTTIKKNKWFIPLIESSVNFDAPGSPIDAYTVGIILGDGSINKITGDPRIIGHKDDLPEIMKSVPYKKGKAFLDNRHNNVMYQGIQGIGALVKQYISTNTCWTKEIPDALLYGSITDRIAVMQGLMDTDGCVSKTGATTFTSASEKLAKGFMHIVKSLGGYARISHYENAYAGSYTIAFNLPEINPCRLKRKAILWKPNYQYKSGARVGIVDIQAISEIIQSKCISVDSPSKSYLIDNCQISHNTTLLGEYLFLYLAVYGSIPDFGEISLALYVSDSIENGVKNMRRNLEYRWGNSDFLRQYIPNTRFTDVRWEFTNIDGKVLIVKGFGARTGVRGTKELGVRPSLAILDDLVSDEDARSATVIASIEDTVYKAINYALHPNRSKTIWSGTPFNSRDPLYKAVESGAWYVNVFPVCEEFPCKKSEFRGAWEDRFNYEYVLAQYNKAMRVGKIDTFNQELQLKIMSDEDRLIQDADISWYKRATILNNMGNFNFYITTDFATSEKTSADYSVISVWAYSNNGEWFWIDGIVKKQLMDANIEDLFRLAQQYKPQQVGVEVTGQQGAFIQWIQNEMLERNVFFNLASDANSNKPGIRPNTNKLERFNIVVPWFKLNRIYFPEEKRTSPEIMEFMDELRLASASGFKAKHDDCNDTISMLASLNAWKPSIESTLVHNTEEDIWELEEEDANDYMSSYIV